MRPYQADGEEAIVQALVGKQGLYALLFHKFVRHVEQFGCFFAWDLRHFEPGDVEVFDSDEEDEEGGDDFHEDSF